MASAIMQVDNRDIGRDNPTYFIADIAANHDGDLSRAKDLIYLAAEAGADAAKFQHFQADKIVSDFGFRSLGNRMSHQSSWGKPVFDVYQDAEVPHEWTRELKKTCDDAGIHFFSAPYDFEAVELLDQAGVPAHKIGSGDITWTEMIDRVGQSGKPVFIATGASEMSDVTRASDILKKYDVAVCLMQCNTNYTGSIENFSHIHLNVLKTYVKEFPDFVLGLSDHTPGCTTVLGAVALGARAIEKHFTEDKSRIGPDHKFSLNRKDWREMIERTRELEASLGSTRKFTAENELETAILQRRCLCALRDIPEGSKVQQSDLVALRPAIVGAFLPYEKNDLVGRVLKRKILKGEYLSPCDLI